MELRRAAAADIPLIHALDREQSPVFRDAARYGDLLQAGGALLVLRDGDRLGGFAAFSQVLDEATLLNLAVAPGHRGEGLGRRLLAEGCRVLAKNGVRRVLLEVRESNTPARQLYEALAFSLDGRRPNYYPGATGEPREAAIIMSRTLEVDGADS